MPEAYAHALARLLQGGEKPKEAVARVHQALQARGRASLWPHIVRAFARVIEKDANKNRSVLYIARMSDEEKARKESGAKGAQVKVDASLIGGWRLEDKETLTDASWKKHLLSIYQSSTRG
jgi:F0F1-type ATP synthase delta subunit